MADHKRRRKQARSSSRCSEEVSSIEWEYISMTEQEEDLIYRMHNLVGDRDHYEYESPLFRLILVTTPLFKLNHMKTELQRWALIAGRIPGRKPEEIERFWIMRHHRQFFFANNTTTD